MGAPSDVSGRRRRGTRWLQVSDLAAVSGSAQLKQVLSLSLDLATSWSTQTGGYWTSRQEFSGVTAWTAWTGPTSFRACWPDARCSLSFRYLLLFLPFFTKDLVKEALVVVSEHELDQHPVYQANMLSCIRNSSWVSRKSLWAVLLLHFKL